MNAYGMAPTYLRLEDSADHRSADAQYDGDRSQVVSPTTAGKPEFASSTEVVYVNGIATTFAQERVAALAYADLIHGPVRLIHAATDGITADLETCAHEKLGFANNSPERAVVDEVLAHVHGTDVQGDVHFVAHSRGALIVQRGLEMLEQRMTQEHFTKAQMLDVLHHVTVETFGGASVGMPPGVRCVNYVNAQDSVANVFGMGTPTTRDTLELGAAGASLGLLGLALEAKIYADHEGVRPNGPIVAVPAAPNVQGEGQFGQLLANHGIGQYLAHRLPFERTFQEWQHRSVHASVERLGENGVHLPAVVSVERWNGKSASGSFVSLEDGNVAMHVGRGKYVTLEVQGDLRGELPALGRPIHLAADGVTRDDERSVGLGRA